MKSSKGRKRRPRCERGGCFEHDDKRETVAVEILDGLRDLNERRTYDRDTIAAHTLERLRRMTERLERGETLPVTVVRMHDTPDGPMHTRERDDEP